jgi:hypothetical protein
MYVALVTCRDVISESSKSARKTLFWHQRKLSLMWDVVHSHGSFQSANCILSSSCRCLNTLIPISENSYNVMLYWFKTLGFSHSSLFFSQFLNYGSLLFCILCISFYSSMNNFSISFNVWAHFLFPVSYIKIFFQLLFIKFPLLFSRIQFHINYYVFLLPILLCSRVIRL